MADPQTNVKDAIDYAEQILPGSSAAPAGTRDPRWQAIIKLNEFIESDPEDVWVFIERWGVSDDEDLRMAIATCLLEHLLEHWFDRFFPLVEIAVRRDKRFAQTFLGCWKCGQSTDTDRAARFDRLEREASAMTREHPDDW